MRPAQKGKAKKGRACIIVWPGDPLPLQVAGKSTAAPQKDNGGSEGASSGASHCADA